MNAYEQMADVRAHDSFHPTQDAQAMIATFHPPTTRELALELSAVTSAFYAVLLQAFADMHGSEGINVASRSFFHRLGRLKARATQDSKGHAHRFTGDVRDVVTVLIAAIYNASPEYRFEVRRHDPQISELHLRGTDRYLRAARQLNIAQHLQWPTLHPFLEGVAAELQIDAVVSSDVLSEGPDAALHTRYVIAAV